MSIYNADNRLFLYNSDMKLPLRCQTMRHFHGTRLFQPYIPTDNSHIESSNKKALMTKA